VTRTLIEKALLVVTMDDEERELPGADVLVEGERVSEVGVGIGARLRAAGEPIDRVIDGREMVVLPGFVNTHHHLYQTLQRNVRAVQDAKLFDWLVYLYEIWRHLTPAAVRVSAKVGLGELLLTGCTTALDHFYVFPAAQPATLLDDLVEAAAEVGIRFHACRGSMSRGRSQGGLPPDDVVQSEAAILADCERVISRFHDPEAGAMVRIVLAPCSPFSVTDDLLRESVALARSHRGVTLHTHLAETLDEERFCLETHGKRPLAYVADLGWLGADVFFAHAVHMNAQEIARMAETGTGVAHCPISNMRLGSGIAPIPAMVRAGVPVGLAVDGSASNDASNLLREVQAALLVHRVLGGPDAMTARGAVRIATRGGARVLGRDDVGALAPGMAADVACFSLAGLAYAGARHDPLAALLFCGISQRAHTVLVGGRVVVEGGRLLTIDEEAVAAAAEEESTRMLAAAGAKGGRR
jgi:cytosine/adenosine deaminase-related metal-dependent hydrolase